MIRTRVREAEATSKSLQLAAWITSWIEIDGGEALAFVEERYLRRAGRTREEIEAVLAALSVHGSRGHTHLRSQIVRAYEAILENYPAQAPRVVVDLLAWERWEAADEVATLLEEPPSELKREALLQLRGYLRAAGEEAGAHNDPRDSPKGTQDGSSWLILVCILIGFAIWLSWWSRLRNSSRHCPARAASCSVT